jgi:2-polyprenyl-3-methyl-5-hydroxy-6-metoxy-1,4-benzoquinol methylase
MPEITNADVIAAYAQVPRAAIEDFGEEGDLTRRALLNPAIFALLGDVQGKAILDAGCGQGYLARLLARKGAQVTAVEPSAAFYAYAVQREESEQLGISYVQADLSLWTGAAGTFDAVIANMVLMDIPDYAPALRHCVAALKSTGQLIISLLHPCFDEAGAAWNAKGYVEVREYFEERAVPQTYGVFVHRTLSTYLNAIVAAGGTLQKVIEPQLDRTTAVAHGAERYWSVPGYIIFCVTRPS